MSTYESDDIRDAVKVSDAGLSFARAMHELHGSTFDLLYFLEKPHKWQNDYEHWLSKGGPASDSHESWDAWALEALQR
jgi:hypothetical protein